MRKKLNLTLIGEACGNVLDEMFGTERMIAALNTDAEAAPEQVLKNVRKAVDGFREAEQFDDLTMLCIEYRGNNA